MQDKHLHIISFDVPYPPNYGGVIDVFYKIKNLHEKGVKIHLHCIEYPGRERTDELNKYCEEVHYYPRKTGMKSAFSLRPYIVSSRRSTEMLERILEDNHPILFEGLHSCYFLADKRLKGRFKIYRESNIEHQYYYNLFKVCKNLFSKIYFLGASCKLRMYQRVLKHSNMMFCVSEKDTSYLQEHFPDNKVIHMPSFHPNNVLDVMDGRGEYALYHGNIEVPENTHAAVYLINEVFDDIDIPLVIAGMNPPERIKKMVKGNDNISIICNPEDEEMFDLIRKAHVNILVTFQATGLKLKLLNVLHQGRFCLVNDKMLNGTGLDDLCHIGNDTASLKKRLKELFENDFTGDDVSRREKVLRELYSNKMNAERLIELVWE
ncbi:MAG: glycosyltransferase family 1 protein [Bacteroidetes bacterium]|nr:MAG: glycosyltransferase family 1 protein [Bacteroidota bacterium]